MLSSLLSFFSAVWPFLLVLTPLVFFHELGHYVVARLCGVKIEVFSIGFGPEVFGWHDRQGTRWKISWIPLGGYVQMYGDESAASQPKALNKMSKEESRLTMHAKPPLQKIAIALAGPFANYLLAIVCFAFIFSVRGVENASPKLATPPENSLAAKAGILSGDRVVALNNEKIKSLTEIRGKLGPKDETYAFQMERAEKLFEVTFSKQELKKYGKIGFIPEEIRFERLGVFSALQQGTHQAIGLSVATLDHIWGMLTRQISADGMGGILMIGSLAKGVAESGLWPFVMFLAFLSVSLGLFNLLPVPMLDGGHVVLYTVEAIVGKPLSPKLVEWFFRVGFLLIGSLLLLTTWNDSKRLGVVTFIEKLFA